MKKPQTYLEFDCRDRWRDWLGKNHAVEPEAWLVIYKVKFKDKGLSLDDAVEEALCFGWIDSTLNRIDEEKYALRFSPRTQTSIWSVRNIQRVEKLVEEGKMTEAGLVKIMEAKANGEWEAALRREQVDVVPKDLKAELAKIEGGLAAFHALTASRKKRYIYWLQSAKRTETKQRRIDMIITEIISSEVDRR
jgi:uncharacterized protein YdeI (YjbR/CyaY-like superfamily)